jgi:hypothetical protein
MEPLAIALLLATANERFVEYLFKPVQRHWPEADLWFIPYVSLVTGALVGWFAGVNLWADWVANPTLRQILTAAMIAGGSELVHSVFSRLKSGTEANRAVAARAYGDYDDCSDL